MKLLDFEVWFYIYLTNTKKFFLKQKKDYNRFLSLFHGLQFSIGGKDPPRDS